MKFNNYLVHLLLTAPIVFPSSAIAQNLSWAQGFTATQGPVFFPHMITDANNNILVVGGVSGILDVDQSSNTYNITPVGQIDGFLFKEDAAGNFQWAKQFACKSVANGGIESSTISIALDKANNIFIAGCFLDTVDFDSGPNVFYMGAPSNMLNMFVVKLNPMGDFIWAKQIGGGIGSAGFRGMKVNSTGIFLAGAFGGTIDVDPGPGVVNLTPVGTPNAMLIEKLDTSGNYVWAKQINGAGCLGLALDSIANLYITGGFTDTVDFDSGPGIAKLYSGSSAGAAIFIAKYDSSGNYNWVKQIGQAGNNELAQGISLDPFGNVLTTGYFGSIVDFDPGPGIYNLTSNSTRSIFTLKLHNNGDFAWARMMGASAGLFEGRAITTDSASNVYTAARAPGGCDADPGTATHYISGDCIVQKLDSSGNFVWAAGWQGDIPGWIGLDHSNSVYITGTFSGANKDFDPGPGSFLLSGSSNGSGFIEKLNQNGENGIEELTTKTGVAIYPNPSAGWVTFKVTNVIEHIVISDITGKAIFQSAPLSSSFTVNLSGNAPGVYFYTIVSGERKRRGKLVLYSK